MAGRPPLLTPEVAEAAGRLRGQGASVTEISTKLGISRRSTFRALARSRTERRDEDHDHHQEARPLTEADVWRLLEAAARRGNVRACELLLRRFDRDRDRPVASSPSSTIDELALRRR